MKKLLKLNVSVLLFRFLKLCTFCVFLAIFLNFFNGLDVNAKRLKQNSIYQLNLEGTLVEREESKSFSDIIPSLIGISPNKTIGLNTIIYNLKKAKEEEKIKGICLNISELSGGFASIKELHDALQDFKKSGKFIVAYADNYSQKMYYLASVADRILINPVGMIALKGLATETRFYKNTFDKLGIEMQIVKVGTFKSAVEPFTTSEMSAPNREQVSVYVNSIWKSILTDISVSRNITVENLNQFADETVMYKPTVELAKKNIVDSLVYADEVDSILKIKLNVPKIKTLNFITHSELSKVKAKIKKDKNKIAVVYAVGPIDGSEKGIKSKELISVINAVAKAENIKAVVLRVNSPGGSAYGSEQIWRALSKLKEKKPLIVSMGDVAASGGYYISCIADKIIAQPTTITGSIGIFGMFPNFKNLNEKVGLTYDGIKTNKLSDINSMNRPYSEEEREQLQNYVNNGYKLFIKRCADGRGKTTEEISSVAEGRVWTGENAISIGLVDTLGSLQDAIKIAAQKAKLSTYQKLVYSYQPKRTLFGLKIKAGLEEKLTADNLGSFYSLYKDLKEIESVNGIQARMPYEVIIK